MIDSEIMSEWCIGPGALADTGFQIHFASLPCCPERFGPSQQKRQNVARRDGLPKRELLRERRPTNKDGVIYPVT